VGDLQNARALIEYPSLPCVASVETVAKRKKKEPINWPGYNRQNDTAKRREFFHSKAIDLEDHGPEFPIPDFDAPEPDAFRVTFQSSTHPEERVTCSSLHPTVDNPRSVKNETITLNMGDNLTPAQRFAFLKLACEFVDVFLREPGPWQSSRCEPHHIDTGDAEPVRQPIRRIPMHQRDIVRKEVDAMLKKGVIRPSRSSWLSPVVLVKRSKPGKDGKPAYRFCIEYRQLNERAKERLASVPVISQVLETLKGSHYFTGLDLSSAFWSISLTEESIPKTAFLGISSEGEGVFEWLQMPFGLRSASFTMQAAINAALNGLQPQAVSVYIDDAVIPGRTFQEHISNVRKVLVRFRAARLFLSVDKCSFGMSKLKTLGHVVSHKGIECDKSKLDAIAKLAPPKNKKELMHILGFCQFYKKFILGHSLLVAPMTDLLKDVPFIWTAECQKSFEELKKRLTSPPILAFPDPNREMILQTDASGVAVGGLLQQRDDSGNLRILGCASAKLSPSQVRWTIAEKELYAIVYCINAFSYYLKGAHYKILTDHKLLANLKFLLKWERPGRLLRWRLLLLSESFTVEACKTHENRTLAFGHHFSRPSTSPALYRGNAKSTGH